VIRPPHLLLVNPPILSAKDPRASHGRPYDQTHCKHRSPDLDLGHIHSPEAPAQTPRGDRLARSSDAHQASPRSVNTLRMTALPGAAQTTSARWRGRLPTPDALERECDAELPTSCPERNTTHFVHDRPKRLRSPMMRNQARRIRQGAELPRAPQRIPEPERCTAPPPRGPRPGRVCRTSAVPTASAASALVRDTPP
jgi:hypothetical protein